MPTEPLEADEVDFRQVYRQKAIDILESLSDEDKQFLDDYLNSQGVKPPVRKFQMLWDSLQKRKLT